MKKKTKIIVISAVSILILVALITVLAIVIRNNQLIKKGNEVYGNLKCTGYNHGSKVEYIYPYKDNYSGGFTTPAFETRPKLPHSKCDICGSKKNADLNNICDYCAWITGRCPECGRLK